MHNVLPLRRKRSEELHEVHEVQDVREDAHAVPRDAPVIDHPVDAEPSLVNVEHVDLGPLTWLAARVALIVTTIGALGVLLVWTLLDAGGQVGRFESFMRSIGFRHFHITGSQVLLGLVLVVAGVALALATFVVLAGAVYNLLAGFGSGIRVRVAAVPVRAEASREVVTETRREVATETQPSSELALEPLPRTSLGARSGAVPEPAA